MITEDYCSYEVSKLLKECGFAAKCHSYYTRTGMIFNHRNCHYFAEDKHDEVDFETQTLRPTHQMAVKWLREKGIDIVIIPVLPNEYNPIKHYKWLLKNVNDWADTYEEAVEAALMFSLTELI